MAYNDDVLITHIYSALNEALLEANTPNLLFARNTIMSMFFNLPEAERDVLARSLVLGHWADQEAP